MRDLENGSRADYEAIAKSAIANELETVDEGYRYRLKELSERSREKELRAIVMALLEEEAEAMQATLFPELMEDAEKRRSELEHQMTILKRDVELNPGAVGAGAQRNRKEVVIPKRFTIEHFRVLPLAVEFVIPAVFGGLEAMSAHDTAHAWWSRLRHQGLLLSPCRHGGEVPGIA